MVAGDVVCPGVRQDADDSVLTDEQAVMLELHTDHWTGIGSRGQLTQLSQVSGGGTLEEQGSPCKA